MNDSFYIQQAQQGQQNAFRFLLGKYWDYVYKYQLKRINNEVDAEDVCIQTFAKAFDKIHTFDTRFTFKTWLIRISENIRIDLLRQKKNIIVSEETTPQKELKEIIDQTPSIEDQLVLEQHRTHLMECIEKLPSPYQELIQLRFLEEKSYKEIAEITGLKLSNVKVSLLRAKKKLTKIVSIG